MHVVASPASRAALEAAGLSVRSSYVERCDAISPPPTRRAASTARLTRFLLSSDLLRVAAWVAVGLCLGSGFALVVGSLLKKRVCRSWLPHALPHSVRTGYPHTPTQGNTTTLKRRQGAHAPGLFFFKGNRNKTCALFRMSSARRMSRSSSSSRANWNTPERLAKAANASSPLVPGATPSPPADGRSAKHAHHDVAQGASGTVHASDATDPHDTLGPNRHKPPRGHHERPHGQEKIAQLEMKNLPENEKQEALEACKLARLELLRFVAAAPPPQNLRSCFTLLIVVLLRPFLMPFVGGCMEGWLPISEFMQVLRPARSPSPSAPSSSTLALALRSPRPKPQSSPSPEPEPYPKPQPQALLALGGIERASVMLAICRFDADQNGKPTDH